MILVPSDGMLPVGVVGRLFSAADDDLVEEGVRGVDGELIAPLSAAFRIGPDLDELIGEDVAVAGERLGADGVARELRAGDANVERVLVKADSGLGSRFVQVEALDDDGLLLGRVVESSVDDGRHGTPRAHESLP